MMVYVACLVHTYVMQRCEKFFICCCFVNVKIKSMDVWEHFAEFLDNKRCLMCAKWSLNKANK